MATSKWSRQSILEMGEMSHIKEALTLGAESAAQQGQEFNVWKPIRETPLSVFFDKADPHSFENERLNPNLASIWFNRYGIRIGDMASTNPYIGGKALHETVSIPNSLSALKIADEILEGAEPWSDWKQYARLIDMETPKVNVPLTKYTDTVGGSPADQKSIDIYKEAGGTPPAIGGKVTTVELDCSGTNNSYRGTIGINRNDAKDNNFLAIEQSLKNAGNEFYYMIGVDLISTIVDNIPAANTDTKANLAALTSATSPSFQALVQVIRNKLPTLRNRADTMFINPLDAAAAVTESDSTGNGFPLLSRFLTAPTDDTEVVNNSGLAASLGLRNVWETPQIAVGTVAITKRDIASVTGLREDLTIESFDLQTGGLYESDLLVRYDSQPAHIDTGAYVITAFNV